MTSRSVASLLALSLVVALPVMAQPTGTLQINQARQQGIHPSGHPLLFSPDPVQQGSSISHWDPSATPNLLMEPAINQDLSFMNLDITPDQMYDVGWQPGTSTFEIIPLDQGFFDPRPFPGAPGNPATTLGEARVNLFEAVLGEWANTLHSDVPIQVLVLWSPQFCDPNQGAVLAAAGTTFIFADDSLPMPDTWYHAALTEALVGQDVTGPPEEGGGDIIVFMNSDIDEGCLGQGTGYYYGLDGNDPSNQIDIAPVVVHELSHGLGFSNFTDETTGERPQDLPGIFDVYTRDEEAGRSFAEMTDPQEIAAASRKPFQVTWTGPMATAAAQSLLDPGVPELVITGAGSANGTYPIGTASFGPPIPGAGLTAPIACLKDDVIDVSLLNGCTPASNPGALAGKIALIDRGACSFTTKVANAQDAGAVGAIIVNNAGQTPLGLGGSDPSITIPAVSVGAANGHKIRDAVCPTAAANVGPGGRFQIETFWGTATDAGVGVAEPLTENSEWFWFFGPKNPEVTVKVLNACNTPHPNWWVFFGGMTNVGVDMVVTDTQNGSTQVYQNPLGAPFTAITDTMAFATCP